MSIVYLNPVPQDFVSEINSLLPISVPHLQIKLFGKLALTMDGAPVTGINSERLQALLAFLVLNRETPQTRQHIAVQLWPDVSDAEAKANLRRRLHELKQRLPNSDRHLGIDSKTVQWRQGHECWVDVIEFETALMPSELSIALQEAASQTAASQTAASQTAASIVTLETAVKLYQGDLLPSCYDDWIIPLRDQLRQQVMTALDTLIPQLAAQNQVRSALRYAQKLQYLDPLYEPAYCHLMRLHAQEGDRASALRVYHLCMTVLQDELGIPPSPNTAKLYETLLNLEDSPPAAIPSPPPLVTVPPPAATPSPRLIANDSGAPIYIERPPLETRCYDTLLQPGALVRVKSPSLMGKTLMMDRVLAQLAEVNLRTVRLSMEMADRKAHFSDLNRFLRWMCINISRMLGLPHLIDEYWDEEGMGSKVSCSTYIEEYVLPASDAPLVLCLDDTDILFSYPDIYEDVFGLLRSWYELARTYTCPIWKQLRLVIVHATDVYVPLNIHQSPFNVGVPVELPDFNQEQSQQFANQHQLARLDIKALTAMVGGHPYLLQQAFEYLKAHPDQDLAGLLAAAPTDSGIYANHLRDCWLDVREQAELTEILRLVMMADDPVPLDSILAHQLHSMGVIQLQGNLATPRCQLYRQYFQSRLELGNNDRFKSVSSDLK